ncbi:MAG: hypothetical protein RIC35_15135 [Marinoscillum sp.]
MKKNTLLLILVTVTSSATAQETQLPGSKIGISFLGLGSNDAVHLTDLDGAAWYTGEGYYGFQLDYIKPINKVFSFESGIGFRHHELNQHPNVPPGEDESPNPAFTDILVVPVGVRVNFLKYAFINTGILIDTSLGHSTNISAQNGIGFNLGMGLQYEFNFGLGVFVNPYAAMHSAVHLSAENYPERSTESGLKIGVTYLLR